MFSTYRKPSSGLIESRLYNQDKFYVAFMRDLKSAKSRVLIESPFITVKRLCTLLPVLKRLRKKGIKVIVNTKPLEEHDILLQDQAIQAVTLLQEISATVLMTVGHHRKIAVIDDDILWEGSLNILSQNDSCEFMRRINSTLLVREMIRFIKVSKWS